MWLLLSTILTLCSLAPGKLHAEMNFSHDFHAKKQNISCNHCHGSKSTHSSRSGNLKFYTQEVCHSCHKQETTQLVKAPLRCINCHQEKTKEKKTFNKNIIPSNHQTLNFTKEHGTFALATGSQNCYQCHQTQTCKDCHNAPRSLKSNPHGPSILMGHGLEAKLGQMKCMKCHKQSTCQDCHRKEW